jgi:hypothetical protein
MRNKKDIPPEYEGTFIGWMMKHEFIVTVLVSVITTVVAILVIGL